MKKLSIRFAAAAAVMIACLPMNLRGEKLVILHTNDTHSQIKPAENGLGGVMRRKALIDSVRHVQPNVMLIDAGDAVQGTLFYTLFKGEVEQRLINALGYDIQILGNHEFDFGMEQIAKCYDLAEPLLLSTNYDFTDTPLQGYFQSYTLKHVGGHKVGIMALNIDPNGLIDDGKWDNLKWLDTVESANAMAWFLKNVEKVDKVVAITHVGYASHPGGGDVDIARNSKDIDIIIGGHSHTYVDPDSDDSRIPNLNGEIVRVFQAKKQGQYLGEVTIDFDADTVEGKLFTVDSRLDGYRDWVVDDIITRYSAKVDSISAVKIGKSSAHMASDSHELRNFITDFTMSEGERLLGKPVDLAIMNKGSLRNSLPKGDITQGQVIDVLPFENQVYVIEISGTDLIENFKIMAKQGGQGVSQNVNIVYDKSTGDLVTATINGIDVNPQATYLLATNSYLAKGGDYMDPLKNGTVLIKSSNTIYDDLIAAFRTGVYKGKTIKTDPTERMSALR